jgi:streptogramin lyase
MNTCKVNAREMNARKLLVSVLMLVSVLLSACVPAATPIAPTAIPPTMAPTVIPTFDVSATPPVAKVIAEWKVNNPSGVFIGFDSVWIPGHHDKTTTRIDPATNTVIAVIQGTGDHAEQALAVGDVLWVTGQRDDTTWIDPKTNTVATTVPRVDGHLHYIAYGFNSLWITTADNKLDRVDLATSQIIASIPYTEGYADCQGFVFASTTAVWVDMCDNAELIKVDPATNSVVSKTPYATLIDEAKAQTTIPAGKGKDFLWISVVGGLLRIDPNTGAGLTFLPLTPEQQGDAFLAVTDEAIWFGGLGQINRVNVATNQIDATYTTDPGSIIHLAIGFGSVWLENYQLNLVQRLDVAP